VDWFVFIDNQQYGPYPQEQLIVYIKGGRITPDDFVWNANLPGWKPAGQVADILPYFPEPPANEKTPRGTGNINRVIGIICLFVAIAFFGLALHAYARGGDRLIQDPVGPAMTPGKENISGTVKLGQIKVPFNRVFADDTKGDNYPDRRSYYQDDTLVLASWDTDKSGNFDLWFRLAEGDYIDLEVYDLTGDGKINKLVKVDKNEQIIGTEMFADDEINMSHAFKVLWPYSLPLILSLVYITVNKKRYR